MPEVESEMLTDSQLRRAEALALVKSLYPYLDAKAGVAVAIWICTGRCI